MSWTNLLLLLLISLSASANMALSQNKDTEAKQAASDKPKSKDYQKFEEKIHQIVADDYRLDRKEIEVNAPISKPQPNAGQVTVMRVLMRVEEIFGGGVR
jgi:hypothetical protein